MPPPSLSACDVARCLQHAPCHLAILDRSGNIAWASRIEYGLEPPDVIGHPADERLPESDRPAWRAAFHKARDRREVAAYSCLFVAPEEPGVRLAGWLAPVVEDGAVRWIVSVCRDVTHDEPHPAPAMPTGAGGMPSRPPGVPAGALWLSAIGTRVIAYLAAAGHAKGEAIADAVGQPHAHRFKSLLTDLADRGILDSSAGHGYRCAGAVGA
jgi:hypothetical protein